MKKKEQKAKNISVPSVVFTFWCVGLNRDDVAERQRAVSPTLCFC